MNVKLTRSDRTAKVLCCTVAALVLNGAMADPTVTHIAPDPNHPPRLGTEFYPPESVRLHEEGTCKISVIVAPDATTHDITLIQSTGYPRLDTACLNAFADGGLLPATVDGKPIEKAVQIPISWRVPPVKPYPKVDPDNPPHIGSAYYPAASRRRGEQGTCRVSMMVAADGKIHDVKLTKLSGFPRLDQACIKAFDHGGFLPAIVDGKPVDMQIEFPITWLLNP